MYQDIEEKFKMDSDRTKVRYTLLLILLLWIVPILIFCRGFTINDWQFWGIVFGSSIIAISFFYIILFYLIIKRNNKNLVFFHIQTNTQQLRKQLHDNDIDLLNKILKEQNITTRNELKEVIRHYQSLLPKKVISSGTLLSVLAFSISVLVFIWNEETYIMVRNTATFLEVLLIVVIGYLFVKVLNDNIFKIFGKYALYERLESTASEIYMTKQITKSKKTMSEK